MEIVVIVKEHLDNRIPINKQGKYLNFKELPSKPQKEIDITAVTSKKSHYKPPINHPWRSFQFSKHSQKTKV